MQNRILRVLSCFIVLYLVFLAQSGTGSAEPEISLAILPCSDVVKTFERFQPLVTKIENDTGFNVQTIFPKNEQELFSLLKSENADFIFHSPYSFSKIKQFIASDSILKSLGPDGKDHEIGYLVARRDSGIQTIQDVKGKNVLFGMECSASRWVCARKLFEDHGIDIEKDLASYSDGGCCEDISYNVFLKAADAGLVCQHYFDEQMELGAKHITPLAVIEKSRPSPTRIFVPHMNTPQAVVDSVHQSLLSIRLHEPEYTSLVKSTEIGGFVRASPEEYESMTDQ